MTAPPVLPRRNGMYVLYESDNFAVVHMQTSYDDATISLHNKANTASAGTGASANDAMPAAIAFADTATPTLKRHGFEIVDKRSGRYLYLDGSWAEIFIQQIAAWQHNTPTREEVEETLDGYAHLATHRLVLH